MVRLDIDGGGFDWAAQALSSGNQLAARYYTTLTGKLSGYGAMAGDDTTSEEFAKEYDVAAKESVDALNDLVDSFATLAILTATSIENHRAANANSVYNKPVPVWDGQSGLPAEGPVDIQPFTPPSSLGGDNEDLPDFWNEIMDHLEGFAWPNANVGKLREAAAAWRSAGDSVGGLTSYPERAIGLFSGQKSPEIPVATEALNEFKTQITDLADSLRSIGQSCDDYAKQVEDTRQVIKDIVRDMAIEAGVSIVAGAIVGFFTFGGGAAAGTAIAGWRIVSAARKILKALRALKAVAKAGAVAKLTAAVSKVKPLRAILGKFKNAKKMDNAADASTPPTPPKPPKKPGDPVPGDQRPSSAGENWEGRVSDNGKGEVWQRPGATGNKDSVRVMEPTAQYPNGYVRYYNEHGQPIGLDGKPNIPGATKAENAAHTHIPMNPDGTYPVPKGWKPTG